MLVNPNFPKQGPGVRGASGKLYWSKVIQNLVTKRVPPTEKKEINI